MIATTSLPAVSINEVVKRYKVRHEHGRTLKETILRQRIYQETINALDQVSFNIPQGKTFGIIGSNGSGKSTLLKLIAGTSQPTCGKVVVNGRVSALLELGAGFHPDFSGRENVFLDGAIMGLPRQMIKERFDQIVDFAGMWEFIDAPAKTYSSGMYLRLAFAVAVNVDPDIVLIDEVFAVGDEAFQRKCLERIDRFKSDGKTIVFVSHSLDAVRAICDEAIWLDHGRLCSQGATEKVIDSYLWQVNEQEEDRLASEKIDSGDEQRWGTFEAELTNVEICDENLKGKHIFKTGDSLWVRYRWRAKERVEKPVFGYSVHRSDGVFLSASNTSELGEPPPFLEPVEGEIYLELSDITLLPGDYQLSVALLNVSKPETYDHHDRKYHFKVLAGRNDVEIGLFDMPHRWINWLERAR